MGLIAPNFTLLKYDAVGDGSTVSLEAIRTSLDDGSRDTEVQAVGDVSTVSPVAIRTSLDDGSRDTEMQASLKAVGDVSTVSPETIRPSLDDGSRGTEVQALFKGFNVSDESSLLDGSHAMTIGSSETAGTTVLDGCCRPLCENMGTIINS